MSVPFVDLEAQYNQIKPEVLAAVNEVIESRKFIMGDYEKQFAKDFCEVHGSKFAVGCSNGTSAITVALRSLGIKQGDEVITPANSFFATPEAIVEVGATPVFVDCLPDTYSIDLKQFEAAINDKTKAIIPVHLYGNPADMEAIKQIADKYDLKIIEDCAQAHLASINGKAVGTFGEFGTFSFYPGKNLGAYGDAGEVITQDADLLTTATMHINHGRTKKYEHDFCAGNFRMDGIQAAVLSVKSKYISKWTDNRIAAAKQYDEALKTKGFKTLVVAENAKCVYHLYPVEVSNRDEVMEHLKTKGIGCGIHYPIPLHLQPALKYLGYKEGDFPISESTSKSMVSIPIFPEITAEQIKTVVDTFLEVAKA
jgi:dTDP-4-amino-4,6-dideoxygalactose transaminase